MIENIADQFRTVAAGKIEGLDDLLGPDITRNQSEKPIAKEDVLTPEITERLQDLYAEDIALYQRIKAGWIDTGAPPSL